MRALRFTLPVLVLAALLGTGASPLPAVEPAAPPASSSPAEASAAPGDGVPLTVLYTTNVLSELEPCGCATRLGGLPRRANLISELRAGDPSLVLLDSGDHFFRDESRRDFAVTQQQRKANILADSMKAMGYDVVCPGETDLAEGLGAYRELVKRAGVHPICSNLQVGNERPFPATAVRTVNGVRIGFLGLLRTDLVLPAVGAQAMLTADALPAARAALAELVNEKVDLVIALTHQGLAADKELAAKVPGIDLIVGGHSREELGRGLVSGTALVVQAAFQGKWVGRAKLRVTPRKGDAPPKVVRGDLELVEVHPSRKSDPHWDKVLEEYNAWVREENQRPKHGASPQRPGTDEVYWGVKQCGECHLKQLAWWKGTRHAHAYDTLVSKAKQHDVECLACHTLAFTQTRNRPENTSNSDVRGLEGVQCESCHASGGKHNLPEVRTRANQEATCRTCHDPKNSPLFDFATWAPKMRCPKGN